MFIALAADRPNFERRYSNPLLATLSTDASVSFEQMATSSGLDALEQLKLGCAAKTKSPQKQIDRIAATKQPLDVIAHARFFSGILARWFGNLTGESGADSSFG